MKVVRVYNSFDSLPDACRALFSAAEQQLGVFFSADWFVNLDKAVLREHGSLRLYVVEVSGSGAPVLALPMYAPRKAGIAGRRTLSAFTNYYTCLFGPIQQQAAGSEDWQLLADFIANESPRWDAIDLHPLDPESPPYQAIQAALRRSGMAVQPYFCFGNWYLDVANRSYRQYFDSLPAKVRNTVKRKSAQLQREGEVSIRLLSEASQADEAISAFTQVYAASWKSPEPYQEFMPGLIRLCAAKGWLRMAVACLGDRPIAAQMWIVSGKVAAIYKLAYDEKFARLSIGSILTSRLFEYVIDVDKVREVDYLTGDEPYKKDWTPSRRERWGLAAYNLRTVRGVLSGSRALAVAAVKRLARMRVLLR